MDYSLTKYMPYVSIIMPTFNSHQWISESIQSVLGQSFDNWELIIVNDGSTDNSVEIIQTYLNDKRIKLLHQKNLGPANARNYGISKCNGEFIAFLDSDDIWLHEKLQIQLQFFESNPHIGLVYSNYNLFYDNPKLTLPLRQSNWFHTWPDNHRLLVYDFIGILTVVVRSSIIKKLGGFNENLFGTEDWDLWIKVAQFYKISKIEKVTASYRVHPDGLSQTAQNHFNQLKKVYDLHVFKKNVPKHIQCGAKAVFNFRLAKYNLFSNYSLIFIKFYFRATIFYFRAKINYLFKKNNEN